MKQTMFNLDEETNIGINKISKYFSEQDLEYMSRSEVIRFLVNRYVLEHEEIENVNL